MPFDAMNSHEKQKETKKKQATTTMKTFWNEKKSNTHHQVLICFWFVMKTTCARAKTHFSHSIKIIASQLRAKEYETWKTFALVWKCLQPQEEEKKMIAKKNGEIETSECKWVWASIRTAFVYFFIREFAYTIFYSSLLHWKWKQTHQIIWFGDTEIDVVSFLSRCQASYVLYLSIEIIS